MAIVEKIETSALVVEEEGGDFVLRKIVLDGVREDELLVEMAYSGVCHSVCSHFRKMFLAWSKLHTVMPWCHVSSMT